MTENSWFHAAEIISWREKGRFFGLQIGISWIRNPQCVLRADALIRKYKHIDIRVYVTVEEALNLNLGGSLKNITQIGILWNMQSPVRP